MRCFFLALVLLLGACNKVVDARHCSDMSISDMTVEQIRAVAELCGQRAAPPPPPAPKPAPPATPEKSMALEMHDAAAQAGMPVDRFMGTDAGRLITAKFYWKQFGPIVVGLSMLTFIWITVGQVLLVSTRTPAKLEKQKGWFGRTRYVVAEYKTQDLDGWFVVLLLAIAAGYSAAVCWGVML